MIGTGEATRQADKLVGRFGTRDPERLAEEMGIIVMPRPFHRRGEEAARQIARAMESDINLMALKVAELSHRGYSFQRQEYRSDFLNQ